MLRFVAKNIRFIQLFFDLLLVAIAWSFSYVSRFVFFGSGEVGLSKTFFDWYSPLALLTVYFLLRNRLYDQRRLSTFAADAMEIMRSNATSLLAFIVLLYFVSDGRISRISLIIYAVVSTFTLLVGRALFRSFLRKLRRRGFLLKKVFIVGDGPQLLRYSDSADYSPRTGIKVTDSFGMNESLPNPGVRQNSLLKLDSELLVNPPDIVVLGFADESSPFVREFIGKYFDALFITQVLPADRQALLGMTAETMEDVHLLTLNQPRISVAEAAAKRCLDLVGSTIGLSLLSPLFIVVAALIKFSSPGPVFYGQERIGRNGEKFRMWKFRSMRQTKETAPSAGWTVKNDPRRTAIGVFIRSTSIDELPQLWNVFIGNMSLVGPRPEQSYFVEKFRKEIPAYMLRHRMKAGITGWAQVSGWRGDTSLHKRIEYDLQYIRNWSLWFDFKILVMTFVKGFVNKNAY